MALWLLKTDPEIYAFSDLARERRTAWTGVANPQAQANLRAMEVGDRAVVYHSGEKRAVGIAEVVRAAFPDPEAGDGRLVAVEVKAVAALPRPVPLAALQAERAFAGSALLRQGRLSVVPLTEAQWKSVARLAAGAPGAR